MVERRHYISPLLHWATEREKIRLAKASGQPQPWTNDPILQKYRFCNVRRRDDRVSQWLLNNVYNQYEKFSNISTFIQVVALCRWINWPPTIKEIVGPDIMKDDGLVGHDYVDLFGVGDLIDNTVKVGTKAWTGAYMVRAPSQKKYPGMTKGRFVTDVVVGALNGSEVNTRLTSALTNTSKSEVVWAVLRTVPNYGAFMAGQIVADLTYTPVLSHATDLNTWAPQGPGSVRGYNRLVGRPLKAKIPYDEWSERLQGWREEVADATGLTDMTLMDLQNCLCETDKFLRVKRGEGRPRSTYKPETAY